MRWCFQLQQVFLLINCFYGQSTKRIKTAFRMQPPCSPTSIYVAHIKLCFKTMTFELHLQEHFSQENQKLTWYQKRWFTGWLAISLCRSEFWVTCSLKILSGGLWGQTPFHNNIKMLFAFSILIFSWLYSEIFQMSHDIWYHCFDVNMQCVHYCYL